MNELPEIIHDDPRVGRPATAHLCGCTGMVEKILRFADGVEHICIINEQTGKGCGGHAVDEVDIRMEEQ